jgi:antirestriction protein ArdC
MPPDEKKRSVISFKQAKELGGSVRKGARATPVVFWKWTETQEADPETGLPATRRIPLLRYDSVFSVTQCEGIRHRRLVELVGDSPKPFTPITHAEAIVAAYPSPPSIHHGGRTIADCSISISACGSSPSRGVPCGGRPTPGYLSRDRPSPVG